MTALVPLAEALDLAYGHDLVHGRVSATTVLLTAEGKPLLDGLACPACTTLTTATTRPVGSARQPTCGRSVRWATCC